MAGSPRGVRMDPHRPGDEASLDRLAGEAADLAGQPLSSIVDWVGRAGVALPDPASGGTLYRWSVLATVGAIDLEVARALEPHVDALSILAEAGHREWAPTGSTWGVYAAEGPGQRLSAVPTQRSTGGDEDWSLTGVKPWCSLASQVSHALITAWVSEHGRGLFAVDLSDPGVKTEDQPWVARGLSRIVSGPLRLDTVSARPVGHPSWYLERDGFAWGGIGVAAVWFGGAVGVFRRMLEQPATRSPDQIAAYHLGMLDARLTALRALFVSVAQEVDAGRAGSAVGGLAAARLRLATAECVDEVLLRAGHALGPAPLTQEAGHAQRVADLQVYVRQHHAERDAAVLGRQVLQESTW